MKTTGACPKCNSRDIIRVPSSGLNGHDGLRYDIPMGAFSFAVPVMRLVCGNCGLVENWIEYTEDISRVKLKYGPLKQ